MASRVGEKPAAPVLGKRGDTRDVGGTLLLYHEPTLPWDIRYADNVTQNIAAFGRHSRFPVWTYNVDYGFRPRLQNLRFAAILLHYSVFVPRENYMLGPELVEYLRSTDSYKVAFFQDEHHWCGKRFAFIDDVGIDCVYTMLENPRAERIYGERTRASRIVPHLPSYVGSELLEAAARFSKPDSERRLDIGYRGRPMPAYMGAGAQDKRVIGERFAELARDSGLVTDIEVDEKERIYGPDWHRFTADSKGTLGTESGASCFDLEDEVRQQYEHMSAGGHEPTVEEMLDGPLGRWDGKMPYRTVSPRNFEAAAFRVCQILFEGRYSGVLEPMRHYIPLKKDFSNFDEVIERFRDADLRAELTENAHADLIESGEYHYDRFIDGLDRNLIDVGLAPGPAKGSTRVVSQALRRSPRERWLRWEETRLSWLWIYHRRLWRLAWTVLHPVKATRIFAGWLLTRASHLRHR